MATKENNSEADAKSPSNPAQLVRCRVISDSPIELPGCVAAKGALITIPQRDYDERKKNNEVTFIKFI